MHTFSRREFLYASAAAVAAQPVHLFADAVPLNVHQQILQAAAKLEEQRRAQFASIRTPADLQALQKSLRAKFLELLDGLPEREGPPPAKIHGRIDGDDYTIDKLTFESFPGYFVTGLLYRPKKLEGKVPGILSPCGHANVGKASSTYQILHVNLAKRGFIVLTYDPVGQAERSQFWDAGKKHSRFNLMCGEHAVLGNPLYLLGTSLARYRIFDGMRGIDYLASLPDVDAAKIGCVGNSGGGTLTAYISALDPRVTVAIPSCYITTLPRRMGNRIEKDHDADPEQDIFDFVGGGIDHAGLLALRAPRPTQINAAILDFFPIEGARETFAEAKKLFEAAGAGEQLSIAEADQKHGLSLPLRKAAYAWFDRWLLGRKDDIRADEIPVKPRDVKDLEICADGQVNGSLKSRHLFTVALEQFEKRKNTPKVPLKELLRLDPQQADFQVRTLNEGAKDNGTLVLCISGNETRNWGEEKDFIAALAKQQMTVLEIDPRGVGKLRVPLEIKGRDYADPLDGVEENVAYNAFQIGKSLLGMRVSDVQACVAKLLAERKPKRILLCGRRDSALVACLAAAIDPAISQVAVEEMHTSYMSLFDPACEPINAASILPRMLRDYGDIPELVRAIGPRKVLLGAGQGKNEVRLATVQITEKKWSAEPGVLLKWLDRS